MNNNNSDDSDTINLVPRHDNEHEDDPVGKKLR